MPGQEVVVLATGSHELALQVDGRDVVVAGEIADEVYVSV